MPGVVCREPVHRVADGILVLPWREFLAEPWGGRVMRGQGAQ